MFLSYVNKSPPIQPTFTLKISHQKSFVPFTKSLPHTNEIHNNIKLEMLMNIKGNIY